MKASHFGVLDSIMCCPFRQLSNDMYSISDCCCFFLWADHEGKLAVEQRLSSLRVVRLLVRHRAATGHQYCNYAFDVQEFTQLQSRQKGRRASDRCQSVFLVVQTPGRPKSPDFENCQPALRLTKDSAYGTGFRLYFRRRTALCQIHRLLMPTVDA